MRQSTDPEDMRTAAEMLTLLFPKLAFLLIVTEFGEPGTSTADFISNADRECLVPQVEEFLATIKGQKAFTIPERN